MFDLTPSERRGALVLLALVVLGALADLVRLAPVPAPEPGEPPPAATAPARTGPGAREAGVAPRTDLNAAGEAELDRLPGIGPVLAARIVAHRRTHGPFRRPEELLAVPGIGPRLFGRLEPLVETRESRDSTGRTMQNARHPIE